MLLLNLDLLFTDPRLFIFLIAATTIALLIAITFHEFSHAFMAYRLGDDTARRLGRLSLNPLVHLDPFGTLMLFMVGFGWGKPVPVNPYFLRSGARSGMAMVAAAGPLSNLVIAGLVALPLRLEIIPMDSSLGFLAVYLILLYSIILAVLNLIPVAPLDGFKVAVGILPRDLSYSLARTERYGPMLLMLVIFLAYFTGFLGPIINSIANFLVGGSFL